MRSRREVVALGLATCLSAALRPVTARETSLIETNVEIKTADGVCDGAFIHPVAGAHPGVLVWHDSLGLRPVIRELGKRIAAEGYATLVPNLYYRAARAPVFDESFDFAHDHADRAKYVGIVKSFLAPGAAERDAIAYIGFLDSQLQVDKRRKIGTAGACQTAKREKTGSTRSAPGRSSFRCTRPPCKARPAFPATHIYVTRRPFRPRRAHARRDISRRRNYLTWVGADP